MLSLRQTTLNRHCNAASQPRALVGVASRTSRASRRCQLSTELAASAVLKDTDAINPLRDACLGMLAVVTSVALTCTPAIAADYEILVGFPRVVDGDTLVVAGTKVRLFGVDAPEKAQLCKDKAGKDYECGLKAKAALDAKIGDKQVACEVKNKDLYGRSVAVCLLEGREDLNAWLVSNGLAVAYKQYSANYVPLEANAQAAKKGVWQGDFQYPADWRMQQKQGGSGAPEIGGSGPVAVQQLAASSAAVVSQQPPSPQCNIKGNINSKGDKIYHVPSGRYYDTTQIDVSSGERWFCSAAEAEAAGWRASSS